MNHPEEAADPTPAPAAGRARERFSTQVNPDVVARVRNAVVGVSQTTHSNYTLAQLTEDALQRQVRHLEESTTTASLGPQQYTNYAEDAASERRITQRPRPALQELWTDSAGITHFLS